MSATLLRSAVLRAAQKKLPFFSDKQLARNLEMGVADMLEAYRLGAEETQDLISKRLASLPASTGGAAVRQGDGDPG